MKYITLTIILLCFTINNLFAQEYSSKINFYMAYSHAFGLREKNEQWNYGRSSDINIYANSFHVKGMYRINEWFSCGIGLGADALRNHRYTTFPVYTSVHFNPVSNSNWILYNNLGYSLDTKISYPGLHYEAGVSRQWMFRKHFGVFLNAGYNLKKIRNIELYNGNKTEYLHTTRQSVVTGFGFIF